MEGFDELEKILVAMSGGVDSSVAAAVLLDQGYDVTGATFKLFDNEEIGLTDRERTCCSVADAEDARYVSYRLGITHYVFNFSECFRENVMDRFADGYLRGNTPNPCIDCNRYVKFEKFLNRALTLGYDLIATGHYAVTEYDGAAGRYLLKKPADRRKDQTYVLYAMTQKQLSRTRFPLGGLTKGEVRRMAESRGFINADKPDSQDICFVKTGDYADFIALHTGERPERGSFVDMEGRVIGTHEGHIHYTPGQRRGLGQGFGERMYVVGKDIRTNTVTLGPEERLYTRRLIAGDVNLIALDKLEKPVNVRAKVRYSQTEEAATVHPLEGGKVLVEFDRPQRAVTPGQAVVFYDGDIVLGGGTINSTER